MKLVLDLASHDYSYESDGVVFMHKHFILSNLMGSLQFSKKLFLVFFQGDALIFKQFVQLFTESKDELIK